jgi:hypothetical protein
MSTAMLDQHAHDQLLTMLTRRYAGTHSPERVAEAVEQAYRLFAGARVHTYVPLLVERVVTDWLGPSR